MSPSCKHSWQTTTKKTKQIYFFHIISCWLIQVSPKYVFSNSGWLHKLNVAHILPKLSIIVVTLDLVLGVNYETYDFILRNTLANIPKLKHLMAV